MRTLLALSLLFVLSLGACDQSQAPTNPDGAVNKATITRDIPMSGQVLNTCCHDMEYIQLSGTGKYVENDNGSHLVVKDITGVCIFGNHHYTGEGASISKMSYDADGALHLVSIIRLISDGDGCPSMTLKIHFKQVWNEETSSYDMKFDRYELICGDETIS